MLRIHSKDFSHKFPGKLDCLALEIIAKRKVAEHLEKGVVPGCFSYFIKIVVFAPCAYALLRGAGTHIVALLQTKKDIFELVHASVGEEQGRIVGGQQG